MDGILDLLGKGWDATLGNRGFQEGLVLGMNGLRRNPDPNISNAIRGMQAARAERAKEEKARQMRLQQRNQSAQWFRDRGQADMADAIDNGMITGADALAMAFPGGDEYKQIKGTELGFSGPAGDMYYNQNTKTNKATPLGQGPGVVVNTGSNRSPGLDALDKAYATDHLEWTRGGGADMAGQVAQIGTVLGKLESGQELTGPLIGVMPDLVRAIANPEAENAKQMVEEVVQRNLRIVLGAQFTEKEGERLISRAYDPKLPPQVNAARIRRLFSQMSVAAEQRKEMADYYEKNNYSLAGYRGPQPNINDFYQALEPVQGEWTIKRVK